MDRYHLAQFNIGRTVAGLDDPRLAGFVERLEAVNRLADESPGFVWRLQSDEGDATAFSPYEGDERMIVNLSVWEDIDSLHRYTYSALHLEALRGRRGWFEPLNAPHLALWWVPAGHRPDLAEAVARLDTLRARGPSAEAFTFGSRFPPPG